VARHHSPAGTWRRPRIGSVDSGPASFGDIRGYAVNDRGWVFVLDYSTQDVRVFDSPGAFLKTVGRMGSGPGEFRNANGIVGARLVRSP
jgi:hypothetical protein